ncbi:hypothetical protein ACUUL3_16065 [Thiovibrio sp. JS02]
MHSPLTLRYTLFLCLAGVLLSGCFYHDPVRHLSSDICLITPNLTAQEVVAALGPPDQKQQSDLGEVWIYQEVKKSTLRKTPFIGTRLGTENYDVVTITFAGDRVHTCVYRAFDEEELKESGIKISEPSAD